MPVSTRRRRPVPVSPPRPVPPASPPAAMLPPRRAWTDRPPTPDEDEACVWRTAAELGLTPDEVGRWLWAAGEIGPRRWRSPGARLG